MRLCGIRVELLEREDNPHQGHADSETEDGRSSQHMENGHRDHDAADRPAYPRG